MSRCVATSHCDGVKDEESRKRKSWQVYGNITTCKKEPYYVNYECRPTRELSLFLPEIDGDSSYRRSDAKAKSTLLTKLKLVVPLLFAQIQYCVPLTAPGINIYIPEDYSAGPSRGTCRPPEEAAKVKFIVRT